MPICKNCNQEFTVYPEQASLYKRMSVPTPDICRYCRWQLLLSFWPFGQFYQRQCDKSGETIISTFSAKAPFPVYKKENWAKDDWQPPQAEIDFEQPFLGQLNELQKKTPHFHLLTDGTSTNCDYCDDIYNSKDCYLTRSCADGDNLYFCYRVIGCRDTLDSTFSYNLEKCYSCTRCWRSFNIQYALECQDCLDSRFLYDCRGCKNCFMCWNLRNAEYCIKNQKYTADEYEQKIKEINFSSWQKINELKKEFQSMLQKEAVHRTDFNIKVVNSSGNYITECKNAKNYFIGENNEDCFDVFRGTANKDIADSVGAFRLQLAAMTCQCVDCYNIKFSNYGVRCNDSEYLDQCEDCRDCFGCVGLRKKQYCILNKQYSEEDYRKNVGLLKEKMRQRGEYGRFLPLSMAYNGYKDTFAYQQFPKTKDEVEALGGVWEEEFDADTNPDLTVDDLPDSLKGVSDDKVVGKKVLCPKTERVFRYIPQEIKFYRANEIPLPRNYYNQRVTEAIGQMAPPIGRQTKCSNCGNEITTYYPESSKYEKIYCEECYRKEIY